MAASCPSGEGCCPAGQGCGADLRCSARALACARCAPGEQRCRAGALEACQAAADGVCADFAAVQVAGAHQQCVEDGHGGASIACLPAGPPRLEAGCASEGTLGCDGPHGLTCRRDGDGCDAWETAVGDCAGGLVCALSSGAFGCACASPGTILYVDPTVTAAQGLTPTGAHDPPACRFRALAPAVQAAAGAGGPVTVQAMGGTSAAPITFAETLPTVAAGVALAGAASADGAFVLQLTGPVVLAPRASLSGFVVTPGGSGVTDAVKTLPSCNAGDAAASLHDARVVGGSGKSSFSVGAHQLGACALSVKGVTFDGTGSTMTGIASAGGALVVDGSTFVHGGKGIAIAPASGSLGDVLVQGSSVTDNADTGIDLNQVTGKVALLGNTIERNCPVTTYNGHRGGGVVARGALPTLDFRGNVVCGNGYDQVLVFNSGGTLSLVGDASASYAGAASTCTSDANAFAAFDAAHRGVGVAAPLSAQVVATGNAWTSIPPNATLDYSGSVDATGSGASYCPLRLVACSQPAGGCP